MFLLAKEAFKLESSILSSDFRYRRKVAALLTEIARLEFFVEFSCFFEDIGRTIENLQ